MTLNISQLAHRRRSPRWEVLRIQIERTLAGRRILPEASARSPRSRIPRSRLVLAFGVAAFVDALSFFLTFVPPVQWGVDLVTAVLLFAILGWQWVLLPAFILEAIPGVSVVPFWVLVVGAVALWGTPRPDMKSVMSSGPFEGR